MSEEHPRFHQRRFQTESIRSAIEEASRYLAEHPEAAADTDAAATAVREEGLRFRVEGPKGSVSSDMTKSVGGDASAPSPGWLLRAALASCDATLVAMEAARDGIDLTGLEVAVESDSDFRGVLGVDDSVEPGPLAVRVRIQLTAAASSNPSSVLPRQPTCLANSKGQPTCASRAVDLNGPRSSCW